MKNMIEQSPWAIGNRSELIQTNEKSREWELGLFRSNLEENKDGLADGVKMTFELLHESICGRDLDTMSSITEPYL